MRPNTDERPDSRLHARADYIVLFAGWLTMLVCPHQVSGDGALRLEALDALCLHGEVSPTPYSLVGPLFSWPLWLVAHHGLPPATAYYNSTLFTIGLILFNGLLRDVVSPPTCRRFLILLTFATMFTYAVQDFYGEVFTAILVGTGTIAAVTRRSFWSWPGIVLGVVNTPAAVVGLGMATTYLLAATRRWRWLFIVPVAVILIMLESYLRRGHPLQSGYETHQGHRTILPYSGLPGFSYPFGLGLLSIVFSFGKGLIFFTPGLLLPLPRPQSGDSRLSPGPSAPSLGTIQVAWLLFLLGLVMVYSRWWAWYGGTLWGPRFFLFASFPASLALAANLTAAPRQSLIRNLAVLVVLALSFWVGANGQVFRGGGMERVVTGDYSLEFLTWYVPEFSVLWHPLLVPAVKSWRHMAVLAVYAAGFLYLAWPLLALCGKQLSVLIHARLTALRHGPPWRF